MYTINNKSNISSIRKLYTKIELQKLTSGSIKKKNHFQNTITVRILVQQQFRNI